MTLMRVSNENGTPMSRDSPMDAAVAMMMPITPPSEDQVTASTRNCSRTSRGRAPIERRMPISRVRSVTRRHDVHDPDAADQQADPGDGSE